MELSEALLKMGLFALVQALVYLILTGSSNIFSNKTRSVSFRTVRSVSMRRLLAALSDMPAGGEVSSSSAGSVSQGRNRDDSAEAELKN
ncbi:hypothetical protein H6P81_004339 [Aristolochia fimbriata]|uniref:Uncharacterized protein n=1 Tax=Aristolochia fimbriata TaxID=158543 RepID=A0AAV7FG66_ARIFI|nr:hypothetical protein H6P81_004339 [Aristolochia fimbriata]